MCGVIGFSSNGAITANDLDILAKVLVESQIRGKHAAGLAWVKSGSIQSFVRPLSMRQLLNEFSLSQMIDADGAVHMIGHARYSTSDLQYNQPIIHQGLAVAHNGVITQADPKEWRSLYKVECKTRNDSEILLHCRSQKVLDTSSISALFLDSSGGIEVLVNGLRPLWRGHIGVHDVWASTYDILNRAGVTDIVRIAQSPVQKRSNCHDLV